MGRNDPRQLRFDFPGNAKGTGNGSRQWTRLRLENEAARLDDCGTADGLAASELAGTGEHSVVGMLGLWPLASAFHKVLLAPAFLASKSRARIEWSHKESRLVRTYKPRSNPFPFALFIDSIRK